MRGVVLMLGAIFVSGCRSSASGEPSSPVASGATPSSEPRPASAPRSTATSLNGEPRAIGPGAEKFDLTGVVGVAPPAWELEQWLDGKPRALADLRGQVVLVRWFTRGCPYCANTAPSLVALDKELGLHGLAVIGAYHHKEDGPLDIAKVRTLVKEFGFQFPVAVDPQWRTLKRWWLDAHEGWTSVSFLIDRKGVLRYVHTGGEYPPGTPDAAQVRQWIDRLLAETAD